MHGYVSGVKAVQCRVWDQLPVNNKHRMSRSNATDRSEDLRCAVVAAVVGVSLVVLGTSLVWFADLAAVQLDQLTQVQAAQDAWDSKFSAQWKLTEVLGHDLFTHNSLDSKMFL